MKYVASLQYGVVFKKAFCDPEIFVAFTKDILDHTAIQKLFDHIQKDHISPEERAQMIEESHLEELQQTQFDEGKMFVARGLLKKGIPLDIIAETTGISEEELAQLHESTNHSG